MDYEYVEPVFRSLPEWDQNVYSIMKEIQKKYTESSYYKNTKLLSDYDTSDKMEDIFFDLDYEIMNDLKWECEKQLNISEEDSSEFCDSFFDDPITNDISEIISMEFTSRDFGISVEELKKIRSSLE